MVYEVDVASEGASGAINTGRGGDGTEGSNIRHRCVSDVYLNEGSLVSDGEDGIAYQPVSP